jgi:hypothetical protein
MGRRSSTANPLGGGRVIVISAACSDVENVTVGERHALGHSFEVCVLRVAVLKPRRTYEVVGTRRREPLFVVGFVAPFEEALETCDILTRGV